MRIGIGFDAHRFARGRRLVLGGIEIPHDRGLEGHSDADALLHAVCDAILGALALGDIGKHFPDTDPRYRGIASAELLRRVCVLAARRGRRVGNVDATVVAQRPKLMAYIPQMVTNIARILAVPEDAVNVKATTEEKLGFTGSGEGISAYAVAGIESKEKQ